MLLFKTLYHTFLDALFPASSAEAEVLSLSPQQALNVLPAAPTYSGLAVELPNACSLFAYKDERVKQLVWNVKYKKEPRAIGIAAYGIIKAIVTKFSDSKAVIIVPMPITDRRSRERGFNQCELITDEMEKIYHSNPTPMKAALLFENDLLIRTHHASRQTLKDRSERIESAKGIFGVNEKVIERLEIQVLKDSASDICSIPLIVIDDVITTGSTMKEAMDTLRRAGFKEVYGLSVAH